jgi:MEDS: MEthanogen/methylotroph, DcmR Sensory domain
MRSSAPRFPSPIRCWANTATPQKEEYDTLLPFICDGLNCGQRAFHVLPSQYRADHLARLHAAGIDVERMQKNRQLEVALPEETYLRTGRFNQDAMLALIQEALRAGTTLGFSITRIVAHAETAVDDWATGNEWVEYEIALERRSAELR